MKKQTILFIAISILIVLLTACASSELSSSQIPGDAAEPSPSQEHEQDAPPAGAEQAEEGSAPAESELPSSDTGGGAPPAEQFDTAEEAAEHIRAVKAAGVEETVSPSHIGLYDKDYIFALKESPLPEHEQISIMITLQGTAILYGTDDYWDETTFFWQQGYESDEKIENLTERYGLERYKDTKFFFGTSMSDIRILWWEHGDLFEFTYPAEINIAPVDVIEHLEVEKYDATDTGYREAQIFNADLSACAYDSRWGAALPVCTASGTMRSRSNF